MSRYRRADAVQEKSFAIAARWTERAPALATGQRPAAGPQQLVHRGVVEHEAGRFLRSIAQS